MLLILKTRGKVSDKSNISTVEGLQRTATLGPLSAVRRGKPTLVGTCSDLESVNEIC